VFPISEAIGQQDAFIRLYLIFFAQYPIGWFMHHCVHGTLLRHIYTITIGVCIQLYMFSSGILHVVLMAGVAYVMMKFLKRDEQQKYVMAWVLAYLSCSHLYSVIYKFGSYDMNITTYTMLLVCKLSALAFCYKDGGMKEEDLTKDQIERQVKELPTILEFVSYVWYSNACALGVFFEFSDYKRWIERTHEYANVPSPIKPSLIVLGKSMACLITFVVSNNFFWMEYCWSDEYMTHSLWYRILYYHIAMTFKRYFYYGPFMATTGAIVASGLGYNGKKKDDKDKETHLWDKIVGIYIYEVETITSPPEGFKYWNYQVHLWLKFYIQ